MWGLYSVVMYHVFVRFPISYHIYKSSKDSATNYLDFVVSQSSYNPNAAHVKEQCAITH
jgi:hypothetical protein